MDKDGQEKLPPYGLAEDVLGKLGAEETKSIMGFADALSRKSAKEVKAGSIAPDLHLVTFCLDKEEYGVPISKVREIIRVTEITRVPNAPAHIRGVTNMRGRIIPVVEIRTRLSLAPCSPTPQSRILVVEVLDHILGLLVDAVSQVIKVPAASVTDPPPEIVSTESEYLVGVVKMQERLIILLDIDRILSQKEAGS